MVTTYIFNTNEVLKIARGIENGDLARNKPTLLGLLGVLQDIGNVDPKEVTIRIEVKQ